MNCKWKNIWKNNYKNTLDLIHKLQSLAKVVINTSCSLLHVPFTLKNETKLGNEITKHFSFAVEKLKELNELKTIIQKDSKAEEILSNNQQLFNQKCFTLNQKVEQQISQLKESDFTRTPSIKERAEIQKNKFKLPLLTTTTIGSFPQPQDVKQNRAKFKKGEISYEEYKNFNYKKIAECVSFQEKISLDVLVHGEFERNDMVEYFGESLEWYVFTKKPGFNLMEKDA